MSVEFTEKDYIQSFKYEYRIDGDEEKLPEGNKSLLRLAELNGKLLKNNHEPLEKVEWAKLPQEFREAQANQQFEQLAQQGMLRPLREVIVHHKNLVLEVV